MMESDDVVVWADGTWCYGHEFETFQQIVGLSDDYRIVKQETPEWTSFIAEHE